MKKNATKTVRKTTAATTAAKTSGGARVAEARHWLVKAPFSAPIEWASGRRDGATRLIVELTCENGTRGYGETICLLDFVRPVLEKAVLPLVVGRPVFDAERLHRHVLGAGYYHHKRAAVMALAAAETAMWDAAGKIAGLPLHQMWGGAFRRKVEAAAYLFINDPREVADAAGKFFADGFRTFKVKIGADPDGDIAIVSAVRERLGPGPDLRADANGAWTLGTAKRQLAKLAKHDLAYIEQPLEMDDLAGSAELRKVQPTPVALDESAYTLSDVANIVRAGAADVVLLDPHEQGGLKACVKAAALCEAFNIPTTLHSGGELGLSQAAYLHLAAACPNMTLAIDTESPYLAADVVCERPEIRGGFFEVPTGPGLGVEVDLEKIRRLEVGDISGAYLDSSRPEWFPQKPAY